MVHMRSANVSLIIISAWTEVFTVRYQLIDINYFFSDLLTNWIYISDLPQKHCLRWYWSMRVAQPMRYYHDIIKTDFHFHNSLVTSNIHFLYFNPIIAQTTPSADFFVPAESKLIISFIIHNSIWTVHQ